MRAFYTIIARALPLLLISGCSLLPFAHKGEGTAPAAVQHAGQRQKPGSSVAPEARKLLDEAQSLWDGPWAECRDAQRALELLDKAVAIDPLDAHALVLRSRALADLGYLDDAFDDCTKAIRLSPDAEAYATRGGLLLKRNQRAGADRDLNYAEAIDPSEPLIYLYRAAGDFLDHEMTKGCANLRRACEQGACPPYEKARSEGMCR